MMPSLSFSVPSLTDLYPLSLHDALPIWCFSVIGVEWFEAVRFYLVRVLLNQDFEERQKRRVDRKSTRLNSSHLGISYAVFCLKKNTEDESSETPNERQEIDRQVRPAAGR